MHDFNDFLSFDPLEQAEMLTGESYKTDETTARLGIDFALKHNLEKLEELALRDDTYYSMPWNEYLRIIRELGFREFFSEPVGNEEQKYFWREGLLLVCNSYGGVLNRSTVYFNAEFTDAGKAFNHPLSGGFNAELHCLGRKVWVGEMDAVEALRHRLALLKNDAVFLTPWHVSPFLYFSTWKDEQENTLYRQVTTEKLALFPREILEAINAGEPRD